MVTAGRAPAAGDILLRVPDGLATVTLDHTAAARTFAAMLPLRVSMDDPIGQAKSGQLPSPIDVTGAAPVFDPTMGELYYWAPSHTIAIFYNDLGQSIPPTRPGPTRSRGQRSPGNRQVGEQLSRPYRASCGCRHPDRVLNVGSTPPVAGSGRATHSGTATVSCSVPVILALLTILGPASGVHGPLPAGFCLHSTVIWTGGTSSAQLTMTTCLLGLALGQVVAGPVSDRYGRRRPLIVGLGIFVAASALCVPQHLRRRSHRSAPRPGVGWRRGPRGRGSQQLGDRRRVGVSLPTVRAWRQRYAAWGLAQLDDLPRSGRPAVHHEQVVIAATLEPAPEKLGVTHWSARLLGDHLRISFATVARIWRRWGLKPWKSETFKFSTDPELEAKIRDVVGLYLARPANAVVVCISHEHE